MDLSLNSRLRTSSLSSSCKKGGGSGISRRETATDTGWHHDRCPFRKSHVTQGKSHGQSRHQVLCRLQAMQWVLHQVPSGTNW